MKVLDDNIIVSHIISCTCKFSCSSLDEWLNHKIKTNHNKYLHTAAIIIGNYERIHSFPPPSKK